MKKLLILILVSSFLLSGCLLKKQGDQIIEGVTDSYNNVKAEVDEATDKIVETKAKIDETVGDIENAFNEIEETKQQLEETKAAIDEVTK